MINRIAKRIMYSMVSDDEKNKVIKWFNNIPDEGKRKLSNHVFVLDKEDCTNRLNSVFDSSTVSTDSLDSYVDYLMNYQRMKWEEQEFDMVTNSLDLITQYMSKDVLSIYSNNEQYFRSLPEFRDTIDKLNLYDYTDQTRFHNSAQSIVKDLEQQFISKQ